MRETDHLLTSAVLDLLLEFKPPRQFDLNETGAEAEHRVAEEAIDAAGLHDVPATPEGGMVHRILEGESDQGGDDGVGQYSRQHEERPSACAVVQRSGWSAGRPAEIWDVRGARVAYDLDAARGVRTRSSWWDLYVDTRDAVRAIVAAPLSTRGALGASCGLCHWREACSSELARADDLTLIPHLGRAARDGMADIVATVAEFAACDPEAFVRGARTAFPGVGPERLRTFHARAKLLTTPGATAYLKAPIALPATRHEIFFDIESDPMRDLVYLHGAVHRTDRDPATERFVAFTAEEPSREAERTAFASAMRHFDEHPDATIFYYSKFERTSYRKLQRRYPDVCTAEEVEALFTPPRAIDLYFDVVMKATEWPTRNHSIKTLAKHLDFAWRDTDPSGAASIQWYNSFVETRDTAILKRILDYNEGKRPVRVLRQAGR